MTPGPIIPNSAWNDVKNAIDSVHYDFNQDDITWFRSGGGIDRFGEDNATERFTQINLKCLVQFNNTRVWPLTRFTESGSTDQQSELLWLNMTYLKGLGYINSSGFFSYQQDADYFVHKGIKYQPNGDTLVSQAKDQPMFFLIILKRESVATNQPSN